VLRFFLQDVRNGMQNSASRGQMKKKATMPTTTQKTSIESSMDQFAARQQCSSGQA